jgi:restriction modification system DNA specificity domain protein
MVTYPSDWEFRNVGEICHISTGTGDTKDAVPNGLFPFFVRSKKVERINDFEFEGEAVLTAGDGVGTGKVFHYVDGRFKAHQRVYVLNNFQNFDARFFYYYFSSAFLDEVEKYTAKSSVDSVRRPMIANMRIPRPRLPEQRAIAEVLSVFDEHLANLDELITKKKAIRDGALEGLMSRDLRLDGYNMPWAVRSLDEIAHSRRESSTGDPMDMDVELENLLPCEGQVVGDTSVRTAASFIFHPGDVLFGRLRPYLKKYWLATCSGLRSGEIWALAAKDGVDPRFLFHLVRTQRFLDAAGKTMGTKMPRADWSLLKTESFEVPEVDEQRAIAEVLSGMDDEIRLLAEERAKAERLKLGAIDDLLTGRVRLTLGKEAA